MAVDQGLIAKNAGPSGKVQQTENKPRGANRSTKVAGKLKVLPDQPDVPSKALNEVPKPPTTTVTEDNAQAPTITDSDEEEVDEEDEPEELEEEEEEDAEVRVPSQLKS